MKARERTTAEVRAARRAAYLTGVLWHLGTFLIIFELVLVFMN